MARARGRPARGGLALARDLSAEAFGSFLQQLVKLKPKNGPEGVSELTRAQLTNVCSALERHVHMAFDALSELGPELDEEAQCDVLQESLVTLHGAAILVLDILAKNGQDPPPQLLDAATQLHDGCLLACLEEGATGVVQDAVLRVCAAWFERRLPGYNALVPRALPYMLIRATESLGAERGQSTLVHTCYAMREALELLDWEDESIHFTKVQLLTTARHPSFLKQPEGRRFIAGLFHLDAQMVAELGAVVRNQVQSGQRSTLEAYGEILFRAWRDTVGPCAAEVESLLQSLMQAAILASTPALAAALRQVLNGLHDQRTLEKRIDPLLVRLYDPILPRAFGAANAEVRRNAVHLLTAAFPIMDPDAPSAEVNARLTQQLGLLLDSLADPCAAVREAAVAGCCHCLNLYWELIPAATSAKVIGELTGKLAFDGASRGVRLAVLRGMGLLVDNQNAQPVLKAALPGLACLLYDADAAIRAALTDLLVAVSACRGLNFWAVVPPEALLEAVARDAEPEVARKITQILVPSYFPNAQEGPVLVAALLRSQPAAGQAFCRQLVARFLPADPRASAAASSSARGFAFSGSVPLEQILKLLEALVSHLQATASDLLAAAPQQELPAAKRAKAAAGRRGKGGGAAAAAAAAGPAGRKRAKKQAPKPASEDEGEGEQDASLETRESWLAILEGLALLAEGIGAAMTSAEECSAAEVDEALGEDGLEGLRRAVEDCLPQPKAMKLVLQMVASLYFTQAATRVRCSLFERLAEGALPGMEPLPSDQPHMGADDAGRAQQDGAELLADCLKAIAVSDNGPKLAAMLAAALGVREPLPLRKPVAPKKAGTAGRALPDGGDGGEADFLSGLDCHREGAHGDGEDIVCLGCRRSQPDDTMLLCDGCDAACHIHCLRPALPEVPETDWFCSACESQLQAVQLPPATAGRCVCLLLQHEEGRQLLCGHQDFAAMLEAMRQLAIVEAEEIAAMAADPAAADDADSTPAAAAGGAEGSSGSGGGDPLAGGPRQSLAGEGQGAGGGAAQRDQRRGDGCVASFGPLMEALDVGLHTCTQLAAVVMDQPSTASRLAALQYSQGVLRVVHVAHETELLATEAAHVARVCGVCGQLAEMARAAAAAEEAPEAEEAAAGGESQRRAQGVQACVAAALEVVLALARQMAGAVRRASAKGGSGARLGGGVTPGPAARAAANGSNGEAEEEEEELPSQQLEARLDSAAAHSDAGAEEAGGGDEPPPAPSGVSLDALAAQVVALLCEPSAAALLRGSLRAGAADLMGELLAASSKVVRGRWLEALCRAAGGALTADRAVAEELHALLRKGACGGTEGGEAAAASDAADPGNAGRADDAGTVRGVERAPKGGGARQKPAAAGAPAAKAQQALAAQLSEVLTRAGPAVGALAAMLVRVCTARKAGRERGPSPCAPCPSR
ncbi:Condensin-2 complex subunit G2 [Tetrabaena socialis]|uniref:Condensin-2 complex subunit G2 n=1 Tax=Tetrabaena socialis TaxID=47790 RepID=A0A2J7ZUI2_9CHLO|nr:Condensin-2 complex subunit G2 [Tetrabaena socialis]|eukprot:PNH03936.1 Condensin-2 complex subunit G2 [Tetrabaena socialis]